MSTDVTEFLKTAFRTDGKTVLHNTEKKRVSFAGPYVELNDSKRGKFFVAIIPHNKIRNEY